MFSGRLQPGAIAEDEQEDPNLARINANGDRGDGAQNQSTPQLAGGGRQASRGSHCLGNASPTFAEETPEISRQLTGENPGPPYRRTSSNASSPTHQERLGRELRKRVKAEEQRQGGARSKSPNKSGGGRHECQKPDFLEKLQAMIAASIKELEEKLAKQYGQAPWNGDEAACAPATVQMIERSKYGGYFVDPAGQPHDIKPQSARKLTMKERRENIDRIRGENYRHFQGVKTMMSDQGRQRASPDGGQSARFRTHEGLGLKTNIKELLEELASDNGRLKNLDLSMPLGDLLQANAPVNDGTSIGESGQSNRNTNAQAWTSDVASLMQKKATADSSLEPATLQAYLHNRDVNLCSVGGSQELAERGPPTGFGAHGGEDQAQFEIAN
jgi:hypothetical protein